MFGNIKNYYEREIISRDFFIRGKLPYYRRRLITKLLVLLKNINENYFLLLDNKRAFNKFNIKLLTSKDPVPSKDSILLIGSYFISLNELNHVEKILENISKKQKCKYILIISKTDGLLTKELDIPKNVIKIYSNNINYEHKKIKFLPMGINFRGYDSFLLNKNRNVTRDILCYCNFSLNNNKDREDIYKLISKKDFITKEHMGKFRNYSISNNEYFYKLKRSKFVICPRGRAIDTFRFYDTIYSGAIPIVIKEHFHDSQFFKNIPILFFNNINEFENLNKDFLIDQYSCLSKRLRNHYEELDFNIFLKNLQDIINCKVSN